MKRIKILLGLVLLPVLSWTVGINENQQLIQSSLSKFELITRTSNWRAIRETVVNLTPEGVNTAITDGANVNARTVDEGWTPLMLIAGYNSNPAIVQLLIDAGADLNARTKYGWTPLMFAAWENSNPEVIQVLLDAGADLEARDLAGRTALLRAIWANQSPSVVQKLLEAGSNMEVANINGWTPLMYAVKGKNPAILQLILDRGANVQRTLLDGSSRTAWDLIQGNIDLLDTVPYAQLLVKSGVDINLVDEKGLTPLMRAAKSSNDQELLKYLIESGANLEGKTARQQTPLSLAAGFNKSTEVVKLFLDAGANIETRDDAERTPLVWAIWSNSNAEIVKVLIEAGANIETTNLNGWSPLMYAVKGTSQETLQLLLDKGALVQRKLLDGTDRTAWDLIQDNDALLNTKAYWNLNDLRFSR